MATRLLLIKADGCISIHSDGGAYKPLNWMVAPNTLHEEADRWLVRNTKGETLTISIERILPTPTPEPAANRGFRRTASRRDCRSCCR